MIIGSFWNCNKGVGRPVLWATNHRSNATVEVACRKFSLLIMMHSRRQLEDNYFIINKLGIASANEA